jgi:hypothetical protein
MKARYFFLIDADPHAAPEDLGRTAHAAFETYAAAHCDSNNGTNVYGMAFPDGRRVAGPGVWPAEGWVWGPEGKPDLWNWGEAEGDDLEVVLAWDELLRDAAAAVMYDLEARHWVAAGGPGKSRRFQPTVSDEDSYAALCRRLASEGPTRLAAVDAALRARGIEPGTVGVAGLLTRADVETLSEAAATSRTISHDEYSRHQLADHVARYAAVPALPPFSVPCPPEQYRAFDLRRTPSADLSRAGLLVCQVHT